MKKPNLTQVQCPVLELSAVMADGDTLIKCDVDVTPYICKSCDSVHLNIYIAGTDTVLNIYMELHEAESLAEKLVNPFLDPR